MTKHNQQIIDKLLNRADEFLCVVGEDIETKRQFVADNFFGKPNTDEKRGAVTKAIEELCEDELNSICSDMSVIDKFEKETALDANDL